MASSRGEFSSRFGFVMAAAGSAVGLGNIWGFPTQAASNGGAAFLLVYLILAFTLAYPALMAELIIGRHARHSAPAAMIANSISLIFMLLPSFVAFRSVCSAPGRSLYQPIDRMPHRYPRHGSCESS